MSSTTFTRSPIENTYADEIDRIRLILFRDRFSTGRLEIRVGNVIAHLTSEINPKTTEHYWLFEKATNTKGRQVFNRRAEIDIAWQILHYARDAALVTIKRVEKAQREAEQLNVGGQEKCNG